MNHVKGGSRGSYLVRSKIARAQAIRMVVSGPAAFVIRINAHHKSAFNMDKRVSL